MNKAKKTMKLNGNPVESKKVNPEAGKKTSKIVMAICGVLILVICVIIGYEQLHRKLVVKVNDEKVYLDEMMYYIYYAEAQYNYMDQMYAQFGMAGSYWDEENEDGITTRESAKEETLKTAVQYEIIYNEAIQAGMKVTEEDKKNAEEESTSIMGQLSTSQKTATGFTKEKLIKLLVKKNLCDRYSRQLIDGFDIDDQAIKDTVNYDEYRQYDIQYYFVSTRVSDAEGNETDVTDEVRADYLKQITALQEKAKTTEDFTTLIAEDDKESVISFHNDEKFLESEDTFEEKVEKQLMNMENGKISGVIESEDGYYLVKMINNNSSEAYDEEVKSAISIEENAAFEEEYSKISKKYKINVNNKEWDKIELGSITV